VLGTVGIGALPIPARLGYRIIRGTCPLHDLMEVRRLEEKRIGKEKRKEK
jgi:hypothetical protein